MAAEVDVIRYVITGEEGRIIPHNATHVSVHTSVTVIRRRLFYYHCNIVELVCHDGVIEIEAEAFTGCPRLKRVIMNGVEIVEFFAFRYCEALEYVECDKLERLGEYAFNKCESIANINLPSAKIVRLCAFMNCPALVDVEFGHKLESTGGGHVFLECHSLQRITLPLKNDLFEYDDVFQMCENLRHVDFVEGAELRETIDTLLWDEWKYDLNAELLSINQILLTANAGDEYYNGEKTIVIRQWITNVLRKIIYYKSQHCRLLKEAASRLQLSLPHDMVMNNVVPLLTLPQHTFDGEDEIDESNDSNESIDESHFSAVDSNEDDQDGSLEGAVDAVGERSQDGANDEERRKRQRTETNGTTYTVRSMIRGSTAFHASHTNELSVERQDLNMEEDD